jgi:hypothetical protein
MKNDNTSDSDNIRIANRSDALEVFEQVMKSIEANGDMGGYVESTCGEGTVFDCLCALKDAIGRWII